MFFTTAFIITGFVAGLVARALKPDDETMTLGKTTVVGMSGAFLANGIGRMFGWYESGGGAGILASMIGAIVALSFYYAFTHRNRKVMH
jgi:uncharacterized membrane protein YeaQ/YmgE (transglycosylase-associated protein family)